MDGFPSALREVTRRVSVGPYAGAVLRVAADGVIRAPLWDFPPADRKAVLSERRRRFGIEDERIDPSTLTEDND